MNLATLIVLFLLALVIVTHPAWDHSSLWGYQPTLATALALAIVIGSLFSESA